MNTLTAGALSTYRSNTTKITYCPPGKAKNSDLLSHGALHHVEMPVKMPTKHEDGTFDRGLSFQDYESFQIARHRAGTKHLAVPPWTLNPKSFGIVVLEFLARRVLSPRERRAFKGTDRELMYRILAATKNSRAGLEVVINRLCCEFTEHCECTSPFCVKRRKVLNMEIVGTDRQLRLLSRPDVIVNCAHLYYRAGFNSAEVAHELGEIVSPWGVRALICRMNNCARSLGYDAEQRAPRRADVERVAKRVAKRSDRTRPTLRGKFERSQALRDAQSIRSKEQWAARRKTARAS
jgi:hypothetical protein